MHNTFTRICKSAVVLVMGEQLFNHISERVYANQLSHGTFERAEKFVIYGFVGATLVIFTTVVGTLQFMTSSHTKAPVSELAKNTQIWDVSIFGDQVTVRAPETSVSTGNTAPITKYVAIETSPFKNTKDSASCDKQFSDPNMKQNCKNELVTANAVASGNAKLCASASTDDQARCVFHTVKAKAKRDGKPEECAEIGKYGLRDVPEVYSEGACKK